MENNLLKHREHPRALRAVPRLHTCVHSRGALRTRDTPTVSAFHGFWYGHGDRRRPLRVTPGSRKHPPCLRYDTLNAWDDGCLFGNLHWSPPRPFSRTTFPLSFTLALSCASINLQINSYLFFSIPPSRLCSAESDRCKRHDRRSVNNDKSNKDKRTPTFLTRRANIWSIMSITLRMTLDASRRFYDVCAYTRATAHQARETRHVFLVEHVHRDWPVNISTTRNALSHRWSVESILLTIVCGMKKKFITKMIWHVRYQSFGGELVAHFCNTCVTDVAAVL